MLRAWLCILVVGSAFGQVPMTFQYFYDQTGQLIKVVDSTRSNSRLCLRRGRKHAPGKKVNRRSRSIIDL